MILFGALFSLLSQSAQTPFYKESAFWHGLVFTSIFNVAVVYAILFYPDWMWMYYLEDSRNTLGELVYLFVFLYYLPYLLGYYLGRDLRHKNWMLCLALIGSMAVVEVWLVIHLFDRYAVIGTREQYLAGKAISLFGPDNPIGFVMNGSVVVMILYFIGAVILYRRQRG